MRYFSVRHALFSLVFVLIAAGIASAGFSGGVGGYHQNGGRWWGPAPTSPPTSTPTPGPTGTYYGVLVGDPYTPGLFTGNTNEVTINPGSTTYGTLDPACANVPVGWNTATIDTTVGPLVSGATAAFYGGLLNGPFSDCANYVYNVTQIVVVAAAPTVLAHVLVGDTCCQGDYGGDPVAASTAVTWVDWAGGVPGGATALTFKNAGKSAYNYMDVSYVDSGNHGGYDWTQLQSTYPGAKAKLCNGTDPWDTGSQDLTDPRQTATQSFVNTISAYAYTNGPDGTSGSNFTAQFFDDIGAWNVLGHGLPCSATDLGLFQQWATVMGATTDGAGTPKIVFNGLSEDTNSYIGLTSAGAWSNPLAALNAANVIGGMAEAAMAVGFNTDDAVPCSVDTDHLCNWTQWQDLHLRTTQAGKFFFYYSTESGDSLADRIYDFASYMLVWNRSYSIYWTRFSTTGTTLHVTPETGLTAYSPLVAQPSNDVGPLLKSGLYVREYASCDYRGVAIGGCAFIVNPGPSTVAFNTASLSQTYLHSVVADSTMVLEGGTIHYTGAIPASLASGTATILVQQ